MNRNAVIKYLNDVLLHCTSQGEIEMRIIRLMQKLREEQDKEDKELHNCFHHQLTEDTLNDYAKK